MHNINETVTLYFKDQVNLNDPISAIIMLTLSQPMCRDSLIGIVMLFGYVYKLMVLLAHVLPIKTESLINQD